MAACLVVIALAIFTEDGVDEVSTWGSVAVALGLVFSLPKLRY